MLKKRNLSAVSTSWVRRPAQASSSACQAADTSCSLFWMVSAFSPAYAFCKRPATSWNCWTCGWAKLNVVPQKDVPWASAGQGVSLLWVSLPRSLLEGKIFSFPLMLGEKSPCFGLYGPKPSFGF